MQQAVKVVAFNSHKKLFDAIERGNLEEVRAFLDAGMSVNQTDDEGLSLLMLASRNREPAIMVELIKRGADIEQVSHNGETALVWAGVESHTEGLKLLLEAGANIYAYDADGTSALHWSSMDECEDGEAQACAELLVEAGMPIDFQVDEGTTPFQDAIGYSNLPMGQWLLDRGANINARGYYFSQDEPLTALEYEILRHNKPICGIDMAGEITEGPPMDARPTIEWLIERGAKNMAMGEGQATADLARFQGLEDIAVQLESLTPPRPQGRPTLKVVR